MKKIFFIFYFLSKSFALFPFSLDSYILRSDFTELGEDRKEFLRNVLEEVAGKSSNDLMKERGKITEACEDRLAGTDPIALLEFLVSDPSCINHVAVILSSREKWIPLIFLYSKKIEEYKKNEYFSDYVMEVARIFHEDPELIQEHISQKKYKELVLYLFRDLLS